MKRIFVVITLFMLVPNLYAWNPIKAIGGLFGGGKKKTEFNAYKKETNNQYDKLEKQVNNDRKELGVVKNNQLKLEAKVETNTSANLQFQADVSGINNSSKQTQNQKAGGNLTNTTNDSKMIEKIFKAQVNLYRIIVTGLMFIIGLFIKNNAKKNKRIDEERENVYNMLERIIKSIERINKENEKQVRILSREKQSLIKTMSNYLINIKKEHTDV